MWCIVAITPEYRERMYRILDLYEEEYDKNCPVVCVDEKSKQLIEEIRDPMPLRPGRAARHDYEYKRNGTRNIFVAVEPKAGRRTVAVTGTRTKKDFAVFVRGLMKNKYRTATKIRIVLDNLNTHFEKSFYETFPPAEAKMMMDKIDFYYTPKHASWLNMAEIEINIMQRECLDRKIGQDDMLKTEIRLWSKQRNKQKKKIFWSFTKKDADKKLSKYYVA